MLETPLGKIRILKNGKEIEYVAQKNNSAFLLEDIQLEKFTEFYRITVDFMESDTISCELVSNLNIEKRNSGGDNYACKVFSQDNTALIITTFDEINNCSCVCDFQENGLIFENLTKGKTTQLVFGISWVTDLQE